MVPRAAYSTCVFQYVTLAGRDSGGLTGLIFRESAQSVK